MDYYTLLLFDFDDSVRAVRTIAAPSTHSAEDIANFAQQALGRCAGFQLWHAGARIAQTYPAVDMPVSVLTGAHC